jgi:hypothetical protein
MEAETGATGQTTGKPYIFVPSLVQTDVPASLSSSPMVREPSTPAGNRSDTPERFQAIDRLTASMVHHN